MGEEHDDDLEVSIYLTPEEKATAQGAKNGLLRAALDVLWTKRLAADILADCIDRDDIAERTLNSGQNPQG